MSSENKIKTIVELDINQAQRSIVSLNATASDSTKTFEERIAAKNKQVELQNQLSKSTIEALENERKALEARGASEKELKNISDKLNKAKLDAVKANDTGVVSINKLQVAQEKLSAATAKQEGSYAKLNQDRAAAKLTLLDLVAAEGLGTEAVIKAQAAFDALDVKVKNADHSAKDFSKSVGDYPPSMGGAISSLGNLSGGFGDNIRKMTGFVQGGKDIINNVSKVNTQITDYVKNLFTFSGATEKAAVAEEALNTSVGASVPSLEASAVASIEAGAGAEVMSGGFSLATAGTWLLNTALGVLLSPITLIVVAAGLLYSVFKDYAPLINPIKDGFVALGAVFTTLKTAIFDLVTSARSFKEIFSSLTGDMKEAAAEAYNLGKATRELAKAQDIQEVSSARNSTQIQKLLLQSKDLSKTAEERVALINKAQKLEEQDYKITKKNNDEAIRISKAKLFEGKKLTDAEEEAIKKNDFSSIRSMKLKKQLSTEELTAYKELLVKKEDLSKTDIQIQEKAQNRKNKIIEKDEAAAEKSAEKAKNNREKAEASRIKNEEDAAKKKEEEEKRRIANELTILSNDIQSKRAHNTSTLALELEYLTNKNALEIQTKGLNNLELQSLEEKHQLAVDEIKKVYSDKDKAAANAKIENQFTLDELDIQSRRAHGESTLALELELLERKKTQDLTAANLTEEGKKIILAKAKADSDTLIAEDAAMKIENQLTLDEMDLEARRMRGESVTALELDILQRRHEQELAMEGVTAEQRLVINKKYSNSRLATQKSMEDKALAMAGDAFGIQKEIAIAQMIMAAPQAIGDSFKSAAKAYAPPMSGIMGAVGAATVIVPIIKGLADIKKVRFPGKKGGGGSSGGGGSISSSTGGGSSVGMGAVADLAANNAARLGVDPTLGNNATASAANRIAGGTTGGVIFSESKYNDFKNQVAFKESKTTI